MDYHNRARCCRDQRREVFGKLQRCLRRQNLICHDVLLVRRRWDGAWPRTTGRMARCNWTPGVARLPFDRPCRTRRCRGGWREAVMIDFRAARQIMVDGQVRPSDVHDLRLIAAMLDIPREAFVPKDLAALAYADCDLPLDGAIGAPGSASRWLIKSMVLARLLDALNLRPELRLLIVGAGSGYSAAVASRLAGAVTAVEENQKLAE